jgi:hypothetical protein
MKKDKPTFIFIIIMCIIFVPLATYGTVLKINDSNIKKNSNSQEFYYKGTLNFYENNTLLGTYTCNSTLESSCGYSTNYNDPLESNINIYQSGTKENLGIINHKYAFIKDGSNNYLYSIAINKTITQIDAIKFYNTNLKDNLVLVKINGKWGLMSLDTMQMVLAANYDDLFLINNYSDSLDTDMLIAKDGNNYEIIDKTGKVLSNQYTNYIYSYSKNGKILAVKNVNIYNLYTFDGLSYLGYYTINNIFFSDNYFAIVDTANNLYIFKIQQAVPVYSQKITNYKNISLKENGAILELYIDGNIVKTIAIS